MRKFLQFFWSLPKGKQIAFSVMAIHLMVLLGLMSHHLFTSRLRPPRPMVIKTISPLPVNVEKKIASREMPKERVEKKQTSEKKSAAPPPKKEKPSSPKLTLKPKATVEPKVEETLLKEIAESFQAISSEPKKTARPVLNIPTRAASKPSEEVPEESVQDVSYEEFLIAFLQNALDLPEFGEVRAKLEIDAFGKLIECQILEAKSAKNAQFLKNRLPELAFPCLNDFGILNGKQTFTITFRNVEIR